MLRDPLQGGVREHHVEAAPRERRDVTLLEAHPAARMLCALRQHRLGAVDPHRLRRPRAFVQHPREHARPAPQVHHPPARDRLYQRQQIVERLLAFCAEARVLLRLPGVAHPREPTSAPQLTST